MPTPLCNSRTSSPHGLWPPLPGRAWSLFAGPHQGLTLYRGWLPLLERACDEILALLHGTPAAFQWVCLDEAQGAAMLLYLLAEETQFTLEVGARDSHSVSMTRRAAAGSRLARSVEAVVCEAERVSAQACLVCGRAATGRTYFGRVLPLCESHPPEAMAEKDEEGLAAVWRRAIEWEVPACTVGRAAMRGKASTWLTQR